MIHVDVKRDLHLKMQFPKLKFGCALENEEESGEHGC